jgi:outer membrane protein
MFNRKRAFLNLVMVSLLALVPGWAAGQSLPAGNIGQSEAGPALPSMGSQSTAPAVAAPSVNVTARATDIFESNPILTLPQMFADQWKAGDETFKSELYQTEEGGPARRLSLKQTIYLALRNNPGLASVALDPLAGTESVNAANAAFDPTLSSQLDVEKEVTPVSSPFQNPGTVANETKFYDWNFGVSKVLSTTNGTVGLVFENNREETNSAFNPVNPAYTPLLEMSISQPLLQNFGWQFATINVRLAQSAQRSAQWTYGSALNDFVQHIGNDYWGVVQAQENLQVAQAALKFNNDLVRVNGENVRVGMMAKVNLYEARSAAATAKANLEAARAALEIALTTLRQDVTLNPGTTFMGEEIEPGQEPDRNLAIADNNETVLEKMFEYSPALAGLREAITTAMLQVKYSQNQVLPQLNIGAEFGLTSEAGATSCTASFSVPTYANCFNPSGPKVAAGQNNAAELPFSGEYADSLNRMFDARFYNYAAVLSFTMPLDNAAPKAALAQARIAYNQARLQYREAVYQAALQVRSALVNLRAFREQVSATKEATDYAAKALHDVHEQFRVGMATTNQVLQYQSNLVTAQGNQVQADVGLENARLALWHAEGTLLQQFNINFHLEPPGHTPWYARF